MEIILLVICVFGAYQAITDTSSMAARAAMVVLLMGLFYSCAG